MKNTNEARQLFHLASTHPRFGPLGATIGKTMPITPKMAVKMMIGITAAPILWNLLFYFTGNTILLQLSAFLSIHLIFPIAHMTVFEIEMIAIGINCTDSN